MLIQFNCAITECTAGLLDEFKERDLPAYLHTNTGRAVEKYLDDEGFVFLTGLPGEGKTLLGMYLLNTVFAHDIEPPIRLMLDSPEQFYQVVDPARKYVILIDDIFGQLGTDNSIALKWCKMFGLMHRLVRSHRMRIITTCREFIFFECKQLPEMKKHIKRKMVFNMSSKVYGLSAKERSIMLDKQLAVKRTSIPMEPRSIITKSTPSNLGYPLCVKMFLLQKQIKTAFRSPRKVLLENIDGLYTTHQTQYMALALIFFFNTDLSVTRPTRDVVLHLQLIKIFESSNVTSKALDEALSAMENIYVVYSKTYKCYRFIHHMVMEGVMLSLSKRYPKFLINHSPLAYVNRFSVSLGQPAEIDLDPKTDKDIVVHFQSSLQLLIHERIFPMLEMMNVKYFEKICDVKNWHMEDSALFQDVFSVRDINSRSLLVHAAKVSNSDLIQIILEVVPVRSDEMAADIYQGMIEAANNGNKSVYFILASEWKDKLKSDMAFAAVTGGDVDILQNTLKDISHKTTNSDSETLLMVAARMGRFDCVKILVNKQLEQVLEVSQKSGTVLHTMIEGQNEEVVNWITKRVVDDLTAEEMQELFGVVDEYNRTALHVLMEEASYDIAVLLVETLDYVYMKKLDKKGENALHKAAYNGRLAMVKHIINNIPDLVQSSDEGGGTALHHAAAGGSIRVFNELLQAGLSPYATTSEGNTVLHLASFNRNEELVRFIVRSTPDILLSVNNAKWTALHSAAAGGSIDVFAELIQTALSTKSITVKGNSILHVASINRHEDLSRYIIKEVPEIISILNKSGETALHSSAIGGDIGVFDALLIAGLSPNAKTKTETSVLHVAAYHGNTALVEHIITNLPKVVKMRDSSHRNALHYAAAHGDVTMFYDLTKAGLKVEVSSDGTTVMHIAAYNGKVQLCRHIKRNYNEIIQIPDDFNRTALHAAAAGGNLTVFSELIRNDLSPRATCKDGVSVLHISSYNGCLELIFEVLEYFTDISKMVDNSGHTALHFAAAGGHVAACEALVTAGISPLAVTSHGDSLLHIAVANNQTEVVTYLTNNIPDIIPQCNNDGESALHYAAAAGTVYVFHRLVEADISSESKSHDGLSVLHIASYCGSIQLVHHIVNTSKGVSHARDNREWNALHFAAAGGSVDAFSELIQAGLSPKWTTDEESTVLHVAAFNSQTETVNYIRTNMPNLIPCLDKHGWNALHASAAVGCKETFEELISAGISPLSKTEGGSTVLHIAAYHGNANLVKHIVKQFPEIVTVTDQFGRSALHDCAAGGSIDVFKGLCNAGLSPSQFQNDGSTLLHISSANSNLQLSRYLIINNPTLVHLSDNFDRTSLHAACVGGNVELFKKLMQIGLDQKSVTNNGCTILHIAAENGCVDLVKFIITSVSDITKQEDDEGRSAIYYAAAGGNADAFQALLKAGLFPEPSPVDGTTILHVAAANCFLDLVRCVVNKLPDIVPLTDSNGWSAIHYAATSGDINIIYVLVKSGLPLTHMANDGSTVLHKAAYCGKMELVKYIMEIVPELITSFDASMWTPLHSAAAGGNVEVFRALVEAGLSPLAPAHGGNTVLHIAAYNGQIDLVKYIITNVPDIVPLIDEEGKSCLHYASAGGSIPVFNELVQAGVSPQVKTKTGSSIAHIAASNNCLKLIQYIASGVRTILPSRNSSGWTALHSASAIGSIEIVQELVDAGLSPDCVSDIGRTMLHVAAVKSRVPLVRYIVKHFEDIIHIKDENGQTALHSASASGNLGVFIELLHAGLSPDELTEDGSNVLQIAANNGKTDLVRYIVKYIHHLVHVSNSQDKSALHCAVSSKTSGAFYELLKAGVSPNSKAKSGKTIAHEAAFCDKVDIIQSMIKSFPELVEELDDSGRSPLHYAAAGGSVEAFVELMNFPKLNIDATAKDGSSVLHIASFNGRLELVAYIVDNYPSVLNFVDNSGKTALHHAAAGGSVEVFSVLLQTGLSPKTTTNDGQTVLHIAAYNGRQSIVDLIIHALDDILMLPDEFGRTALHYSAAGGHVDVFVTLVEAGLPPHAKTSGGSTVLHLAAANARLQLVKHIMHTDQNYIFSTDEQGRTALHLIAPKPFTELFDILVEAGLSPVLEDKTGNTPLDLASTLLQKHISKNYPEFKVKPSKENVQKEQRKHSISSGKNQKIIPKDKNSNSLTNGHSAIQQNETNDKKNRPSKACIIQ